MYCLRLFLVCSIFLILAACGGIRSAPTLFGLTVPATLSIVPGGQAPLAIMVTRPAGFTDDVKVSLTGLEDGVSAQTLVMPAEISKGVLTISAAATTGHGSARLTVRAESGGISDEAQLELTVAGGDASASSEDLISQALANGEIDEETALVYNVYSVFGDQRLPGTYRGEGDHTSQVHILNDVVNRFDNLSTPTQATLEPFFIPPFYDDSWFNLPTAGHTALEAEALPAQAPPSAPGAAGWVAVESSERVKVWYQTKYAEDQAKAASIAREMDRLIWGKLTTLMRTPVPDGNLNSRYNGGDGRLVIVLTHDNVTSIYNQKLGNGICGARASYIVLDRGSKDLFATAAHEFMHAVTSAYDQQQGCAKYKWLSEASST